MAQATVSPKVAFIDVPAVGETFADSVHDMVFDGQTLRIQLCVTRMAEQDGAGKVSGRRYTVCRLVLPPGAAIELSQKLSRTLAAIVKQGIARKAEAGAANTGGARAAT